MMPRFTVPRDRDAWATIRGYVYQVDLTIARWLDLEPRQILELECGEDIDIVSQAITATGDEQHRLLEQVKHRESSVTLRTSAAIAALVNFYEHRMANADMRLLFRYTTNAEIGRERRSPMPRGTPALTAWELVRAGAVSVSEQQLIIDGICSLLSEAQRPSDIHEKTWQQFQAFLQQADDAQLLAFVQAFEWSTGVPPVQELRHDLQQRLINEGYAIDQLQAEAQYQRLFLHVFQVLSFSGTKQLRVEDRTHLFALPTLNATDHALLETLRDMSVQLGQRLDAVEGRIGDVEDGLANMHTQVQQLIRDRGVNAVVSYTLSTPALDIPLLGDRVSRREQTIQTLKHIVTTRIWTAIHGGASTGKTHLAILLAQELGTCQAWVRLGPDYTNEQACVQLDAACAALLNEPVPSNRAVWYERLAKNLGRHALVVLDDLPQLSGRDRLSERLRQLTHAFQSQGVLLVSTSVHELPVTLRHALHHRVLHTWATPPFSQREAAELLQTYEAPDHILAKAKFVNTLAKGHPQLIAAIAHYLFQHNWQFDEQMLTDLFLNKHMVDIKEETRQRLQATIEDENSRGLLYRLTIISGVFSFEEVRAVATVDPAVDRPRERLTTLIGPWIEREQQEWYHISPLIRAVGTEDLSAQTKKACNRALAEQIISTRRVHIAQALRVLQYLLNAEEYNRAGLFTISLLLDIQRQPQPVEDYGFVSLWAREPLPQQMDLGIRLYLRGIQFAILSKRGEQTVYIEEDLTALLPQASANEAWAILSVWAAVRETLPQIRLSLLQVLQQWPQALLPNGEPLASIFPEDMHPEALIWACVQVVETVEQLHSWIKIVEQLTEEQRHYAFHMTYAEYGCMHLANRVWEHEAKRSKEQQHWEPVLEALRALADRASRLHLELLWACAIRAQIIVLAEYCQHLAEALSIVEGAITQASDDPRVHFLLRECMGRQYLYAHEEKKAYLWLQQALNQPTLAYSFTHIVALLNLSHAIGSADPQLAVQYVQQAVQLAQTDPTIEEIEAVKALSELSIAYWLVGDQRGAFDAWDQAGERLLACRAETDEWKGLFVLYGHVSGYFAMMTRTGKPPVATQEGEPYLAPTRGFFLTNHGIRASRYDRNNDCFMIVLLAEFAEAVGRDERAVAWAQKGLDLSWSGGNPSAYYQLSAIMIPYLVVDQHYAEALDVALEAGMISVALREQRNAGGNVLETDLDISALLGTKPSEQWKHAEYQAAQIALLPMMFSLGTTAMGEADAAQKQAGEITACCREISVTAADHILWDEAIELFEQTFVRKVSAEELRKKSNAFDPQHYSLLRYLGYLGASLQRDIPLHEACYVHALILSYMEVTVFPPLSTTYRRIISPFFVDYWTAKFEQQRFRFRTPRTIEAEMYEAQTMPENKRAQAILQTVAYGLDVEIKKARISKPE